MVLKESESRTYLNKIGLRGEILSTPEHSPDSITLIVDGLGAFVGDMPPFEYLPIFHNSELDASWRKVCRQRSAHDFSAHPEPFVPDLTLLPPAGWFN